MVVLGKEALGAIHEGVLDPGSVISWPTSPASIAKAQQARVSTVPASHQQARHLRNFCEHATRGVDMSPLCIGSWDVPDHCDIRVLMHASTRTFGSLALLRTPPSVSTDRLSVIPPDGVETSAKRSR